MNTRKLLLVSIVVLALTTGCASSAFKTAMAEDSVASYDRFLARHGDSKYGPTARTLRESAQEEALFEWARYQGNPAAYQKYLDEYPEGRFSAEAQNFIMKIRRQEELAQAVALLISHSHSAREQAVLLSHASGPLLFRLRGDRQLNKYYTVLDQLRVTRRDIVVTSERSDCTDIPIIGTLCDEYLYAGKILKGDLVYVEPGTNHARTIHLEEDLSLIATDSGDYEMSGWHHLLDREAFGDATPFMEENQLTARELFDRDLSGELVDRYFPTRFSRKSFSADGGIAGFIQDHPIASLVIGAALIGAFGDDDPASIDEDRSGHEYESTSSTQGGSRLLGNLFSCAGQSMAGRLIENPAAAGAISEAIRATLDDGEISLRGASEDAAKNYIAKTLRDDGNDEAAALVEAGDFLLCVVGSQ